MDGSVEGDMMVLPDGVVPDAGPGELCGADCDVVVVDAAWLAEHLGASDLAVLDTRGASAFEAGHVPGALLVDTGALRRNVGGISGQVAPTAELEAAFREAGLARDDAVVVMGDETTTGPARVFWTLEYAGHPRVLFLDGGWGAWTAGSGAVETGAPAAAPSSYTIDALDEARRVDADWIRDRIEDEGVALYDARSTGEYEAGHIAGAESVNWTTNVTGGALRAEGDVRALYPGLGDATTAVAYCQTGSRASVTYLVLRWLGAEDARLYDGSWAEWSTLDAGTYPREP